MVTFEELPAFVKDLKKLKVSLHDDLSRFKGVIEASYGEWNLLEQSLDLKRISGIESKGVSIPIYKARKFRCKALNRGSQSGIRVIFAHCASSKKVILIEIYAKNEKENHDEQRILDAFKNKSC